MPLPETTKLRRLQRKQNIYTCRRDLNHRQMSIAVISQPMFLTLHITQTLDLRAQKVSNARRILIGRGTSLTFGMSNRTATMETCSKARMTTSIHANTILPSPTVNDVASHKGAYA